MSELHLYELADSYRNLLALMEDAQDGGDEAMHAALSEALAVVSDDFDAKVDAIAALVREQQALAEVRKAEAKRLADSAKAAENRADGLKQYLLLQLLETGREKVTGKRFTVAVRVNPPSVAEVDEDAALARGWAEPVTTLRVDRKAIIEAWKADPEAVAGVATVGQGRRVDIR